MISESLNVMQVWIQGSSWYTCQGLVPPTVLVSERPSWICPDWNSLTLNPPSLVWNSIWIVGTMKPHNTIY